MPRYGDSSFHGNKNSGRKGFGLENAKKHLLQQAYWIVNKKLEKTALELSEKEKIELAKHIVLKELGSNIDFTSAGKKIGYDAEQIAYIAQRIVNTGKSGD